MLSFTQYETKKHVLCFYFIYVTEYHVIKHVALRYNNKLSIEKEYKINFFFSKMFEEILRNVEILYNTIRI